MLFMAALPIVLAAQSGHGGLRVHRAAEFDAQAVALDDQRREEQGELHLYGRSLALGVSSTADGSWSVEAQDRVCRLAVTSPGAQAMELFMEEVFVPAGARMRILDSEGMELHPVVNIDPPVGVHEFSTPLVAGDAWVLEYREPADASFQGRFALPLLGHAYRDVPMLVDREGDCHVNVACTPESNGWEGPIRATVRISVVVPQGAGWCSGTLMNNVRQDCTPYFLTAWHCGRTSTTAQFNQYKFYFNFQYATCAGGAYSTSQLMTGAQLKAYSDDYVEALQGLGGSDFMLLRTNVAVPASFDPYWAGWDATNISNVAADGVCIHHPTGAPKRISSYTQTLTTGHPMASSGLLSHYKLKWAQTVNGFGITEYGSSGSGVFKPHAVGPVLIGTLTGSSSGMTCTNNTGTSYFGKMSYHWTGNPNTAAQKLKAWLDPDDTGTLAIGGSASPCSFPAGVERVVEPELVLAPNPAQDRIWVKDLPNPAEWMIFDASGRPISKGLSVDATDGIVLQDIAPGLYTLQLFNTNGTVLRAPFIIVH